MNFRDKIIVGNRWIFNFDFKGLEKFDENFFVILWGPR